MYQCSANIPYPVHNPYSEIPSVCRTQSLLKPTAILNNAVIISQFLNHLKPQRLLCHAVR